MSVGTNQFLLLTKDVCLCGIVHLNACIPTVSKDIQPLMLSDACSHTYLFLFSHICVVRMSHPGYPQVGFVQMEGVQHWWGGGGVVRGSWAVGWGSNGSRNRPCSAAPGSLIIVSAVNVFGVRE